jgi:hypothetical protein
MWIADPTGDAHGCCEGCGRDIELTDRNIVSFEPDGAGTASVEDLTPAGPTTCIRCGKEFRGDWDRHETDDGVYCHLCANQYGAGIVDYNKLDIRKAEKGSLASFPGVLSGWYEEPDESTKYGSPNRHRDRTAMLLGSLAAFIALSLAHRFLRQHDYLSPEHLRLALGTLTVLIGTVKFGTILYFTLDYTQRLPNSSVLPNAAAMFLVALPFLLLVVTLTALLGPMAAIAVWLISLLIISEMYNFGLREIIIYLMFAIVGNLIAFAIGLAF